MLSWSHACSRTAWTRVDVKWLRPPPLMVRAGVGEALNYRRTGVKPAGAEAGPGNLENEPSEITQPSGESSNEAMGGGGGVP